MSDTRTIVIVGAVAGGASAATRARRCNESARIILYEKDRYASFANCGLPYYLGGEIEDREKLLVAKPPLFADRFNIELHTRHEVTGIDPERRVVTVLNRETGESFEQPYDRLILAAGAAPFVPPVEGAHAPNVFTLRSLEDADAIHDFIAHNDVRRPVVVGAGFIGLEMAEQMHRRGMAVEVLELAPQVLPPLDPEMAAFIEEELLKEGVGLHTSDALSAIRTGDDGRANAVITQNGKTLDADLVILSIGVRPMLGLAEAIGLHTGATGGITVNEHLQTNHSEIYAAGDSVEYCHGVTGTTMRVPLAGPANRAGRIAGQHAATDEAPAMAPVLGTAIIRVFSKTAATTGLSSKAAKAAGLPAKSVVITANNHAGYFPGAEALTLKLVYSPETGRILGAQSVGGSGVDKRIDVIATAIGMRGTVRDLSGLDLCYAPPFGSAKDPVHMAAFAACNDLDGIATLADPTDSPEGKQYVDVRNPAEVAACSDPRAIAIPLDQLRDRLGELDPALPTLVTCQSGLRSHVGVCILKQHGFAQVENQSGGMLLQRRIRPTELQIVE
ncbi:MAG: NADH oxidase [Candidatus Hydrogenedens sp.]|nr:NADH oxidase [Candidatus Hydrogenedens sp.]